METLAVELAGQQVPEAAVAAGDDHVFPFAAVDSEGVPDKPADGGEEGQQRTAAQGRLGFDHLETQAAALPSMGDFFFVFVCLFNSHHT